MARNHNVKPPLHEVKQQLNERRTQPPAQTFASFTKALAGALVERRAARTDKTSTPNKNN